MPNNDKPAWIRWHQLPQALTLALLQENATIYLALHAYNNRLAVLAVPAADRINLSEEATKGRISTTTVTMTIVHTAPNCRPRAQSPHRNRVQKR